MNLIIVDKTLYALKIVPKTTIDKTKRIEHVKNEKYILQSLRKFNREDYNLESGASQRNKGFQTNRQGVTSNNKDELDNSEKGNYDYSVS